MSEKIQKVHTSCKTCCFAVYENGEQTDCSLGRIKMFSKRNSKTVLPVWDAAQDKFFVINGRHCEAHREKKSDWAQDKDEQQQIKTVREELQPRVCAMVLVKDQETDFGPTISSLKNQTMPFKQVLFVDVNSGYQARTLNAKLMVMLSNSVTWRMVINKEKSKTIGRFIDLAFDAVKSKYYLVVDAGEQLPTKLIEQMNDVVANQLFQIGMITAPKYKLYQRGLHQQLAGNKETKLQEVTTKQDIVLGNLEEKIKFYADQHDCEHIIWSEYQLCQKSQV